MQNAECKMQNEMQNAECKMQNEVQIADTHFAFALPILHFSHD
jgi:hypothetical protein